MPVIFTSGYVMEASMVLEGTFHLQKPRLIGVFSRARRVASAWDK